MAKVQSEFQKLLSAGNKAVTAKRAGRLALAAKNAQAKLLMTIQDKIHKVEDSLEDMLDMSASNQSTTLNRIDKFDADEFVTNRHKLRIQLVLLNQELEQAEEDTLYGE